MATLLVLAVQTLLSLLGAACTSDENALTPAAFRIACVIVADIIVKTCSEWATWKSDLQQIVDASLAQKSAMGAIMVCCTLSFVICLSVLHVYIRSSSLGVVMPPV